MPCTIISSPARASRYRSTVQMKSTTKHNHKGMKKRTSKWFRLSIRQFRAGVSMLDHSHDHSHINLSTIMRDNETPSRSAAGKYG